MHYFRIDWLAATVRALSGPGAAYHIARKAIPSKGGDKVAGVKLEMFIFDPFHTAEKTTLFEVGWGLGGREVAGVGVGGWVGVGWGGVLEVGWMEAGESARGVRDSSHSRAANPMIPKPMKQPHKHPIPQPQQHTRTQTGRAQRPLCPRQKCPREPNRLPRHRARTAAAAGGPLGRRRRRPGGGWLRGGRGAAADVICGRGAQGVGGGRRGGGAGAVAVGGGWGVGGRCWEEVRETGFF